MLVSGTGITTGTTVNSISGNTVTLSAVTTAAIASEVLTFGAITHATTGTSAQGTTSLSMASHTGVATGQGVSGYGIAYGTVVSAFSSPTVTLSEATVQEVVAGTVITFTETGTLTFIGTRVDELNGNVVTLSNATTQALSSSALTFHATDGRLTFSGEVVTLSEAVTGDITGGALSFTATDGILTFGTADQPTACQPVANAAAFTCSDAVATSVSSCEAGYHVAGSYVAQSTSNSCVECTPVANALSVTCTSAAATQVVSCQLNFKKSGTYNAGTSTSDTCDGVENRWPPELTMLTDDALTFSYHEKGLPVGFDPTRSAYWQDPCALFETLFISNTTVLKSATLQFINDYTDGDYLYYKPKVDSATGMLVEGMYDPATGTLEVRNKASSYTYQAALRTIGYRASGTFYDPRLQQPFSRNVSLVVVDEDGKQSNMLLRNVSVSGAARVYTDVKPGTISCESDECSPSLIPGYIADKIHRVVTATAAEGPIVE
jgi:hypothetical protein